MPSQLEVQPVHQHHYWVADFLSLDGSWKEVAFHVYYWVAVAAVLQVLLLQVLQALLLAHPVINVSMFELLKTFFIQKLGFDSNIKIPKD